MDVNKKVAADILLDIEDMFSGLSKEEQLELLTKLDEMVGKTISPN